MSRPDCSRRKTVHAANPVPLHVHAVNPSWNERVQANAIEPYRYLAHLFSELPQRNVEAGDPIDDLLPWNVDLPDPAASGA